MHREMSIKEMGGEADATREAGKIKLMTPSTGRARNATSVVKKYIQIFIAKIQKKRKCRQYHKDYK